MARPQTRPLGIIRWRNRLPYVLLAGAFVALLAGGGFVALESRTVASYWEGMWWALSLITTVGFVGETPETTGGRILSAVLIMFGFGLMTVTTAVIASLFVREEEEPVEAREQVFEGIVLDRLDDLATRLEAIERALPRGEDAPGASPRERP